MENDESLSDIDSSEEITIPETASDAPVSTSMSGEESEPREKSRRPLAAALVLLLLGGGAYGGYLYWQRSHRPAKDEKAAERVARAAVVTPPAPATVTETTASAAVPDIAASESVMPVATQTTGAAEKKPEPKPKPKITSDTGFKIEKTANGFSVSNLDPPRARASSPSAQPAASPASDPARKRYDAMAQEYAATRRDTPYSIQFEIVCQTDSVTKALTAGGSSVWFVPINYQGRSCFRVFWGRYDSSTSAEQGIAEIPAELRSGKPVVVRPAEVIKP